MKSGDGTEQGRPDTNHPRLEQCHRKKRATLTRRAYASESTEGEIYGSWRLGIKFALRDNEVYRGSNSKNSASSIYLAMNHRG